MCMDLQSQVYYWREITDEGEKSVPVEITDLGDEDEDGIMNAEDWCVQAVGTKRNHGCPEGKVDQAEKFEGGAFANFFPFADQDGDGVANQLDYCDSVPGVLDLYGCPTENLMKVSKLNAAFTHTTCELQFPDSSLTLTENQVEEIQTFAAGLSTGQPLMLVLTVFTPDDHQLSLEDATLREILLTIEAAGRTPKRLKVLYQSGYEEEKGGRVTLTPYYHQEIQ